MLIAHCKWYVENCEDIVSDTLKIMKNFPTAYFCSVSGFQRLTAATQWNDKGEKLILNRMLEVTKSCTLELVKSVFLLRCYVIPILKSHFDSIY